MKHHIRASARLSIPLASAIAALLASQSVHAANGTWSGATNGDWLTGTNWNTIPGSPTTTTNTDFALFSAAPNAAAIGVNFATTAGVYYLGGIDNTNNTARNIGNNSGTAGVLTLNGTTINGVANTIIRNSTASLLTIQANQGANAAMGLELGNATNNFIQITGTGGITISGNITGAAKNLTLQGGLTGVGVLTLSGTNSYTGNTTIDSGTLRLTQTVSLYNNGAAAAWSKDNLVVNSGATVILNVGGSGQFAAGDVNTLLGLSDSSGNGFKSGSNLGLDTAGGSVTYTDPIANPNSGNNRLSVFKLGANTLTLEEANTYTGGTFISAGTLQLGNAGTTGKLSASSEILNNGTLTINRSDAVAQGTDFSAGPIAGSGALIQLGGGTTTLSAANTFTGTTTVSGGVLNLTNALALQNSTLVTTGAGTLTITGPSTLTVGGLSGATGDLASLITGGFTGGVTALTLNTAVAGPFTYGGIIDNGAMSLTKTGTGTQILSGANAYTGATIVNGGTLTVGSGATGSLSSSSTLQMGGGIFNYSNTGAVQTVNGLTVGAGNSAVNNTATGQTLTLGAITRTTSVFGTVNFATLTGPISTTTGNSNGIVGPWATTGATTALRYAVGSPDGSTPTNISALTGTAGGTDLVDVTDATVNYEYSAAATTATNLTGNTLRYAGAAAATAIGATNTLTLNGLMQAGTGLLTISGGPSTGGLVIGATNELVIAANAQATTISAVIADGASPGRLVYNGGAGALTLSGTNLYTGGTVLNSGTVILNNTAGFGTGDVLASGTARINVGIDGASAFANDIEVGAGTTLTMQVTTTGASTNPSTATFNGVLSGTGNLFLPNTGSNAKQGILAFNNTANTFTGNVILSASGSGDEFFSFKSIGDGGNFTIAKNGNRQGIIYTGDDDIEFNTRQINIASTMNNAGTTPRQGMDGGGSNPVSSFANNGVGTLTFNTNMAMTTLTASDGILFFSGSNSGDNTFGGTIGDPAGSVRLHIGKLGTGTWILGGDNTYEGDTIVANGILSVAKIANTGVAQPLGLSQSIQLAVGNNGTSGTLVYTGATDSSTDKQVVVGPRLQNNGAAAGSIVNNGAGTLTFSNGTFNEALGNATVARTLTLGGSNAGANTISGTVQNNASSALVNITKTGDGKWIFAGANTYTGNTAVNGGTLELADNAQLKFVLGASSGTNNKITGTGTLTLDGDFVIDTTAANALSSGTWNIVDNTGLAETYTANFSVVGFTPVGSTKWEKFNGVTKKFTFDEATGSITIEQHTIGASATVSSFSETASSPASVVTVSVPVAPLSDLLVTISADATEVTVPATVTILAGNTSANFNVDAVNDAAVDGDQVVAIGLSATGYNNGSVNVTVTDVGVGGTYASWIAGFPDVGAFTAVGDDADGDGSDNGVENFFGTDPSEFTGGLVFGTLGVGTFTVTHPQSGTLATDLTPVYQWSKDLVTFNANGATDGGGTTVTLVPALNTPGTGTTTVTATVTGPAGKVFVNVKVTQP